MNIAVIISYYAPAWSYGGPPRIVYEISKKLIQRGHSVTVFTTDAFERDKRIDVRFKEMDGIEVYYLRNLSNSLAWNQKIFLPVGQKKRLKERVKQFDVGFISDLRTMQNAIAYRIFKEYKIPYIVSAYGSLPRVGSVKKYLKVFFDIIWGYDLLRSASKVFAQTEHESGEYLKLGVRKEKVEIVPLGIDFNSFQDSSSPKGLFRKRHKISEDDKVILFLGRIHELKFTPVFIEAFRKLSDKYKDLKLIIAGRDDGYLGEVKNRLKDKEGKYIFVGPLYDKEKISAYIDADVFCLAPSHYEETSTAALEALACGTPVVITEQCEITGLDEHGVGLTVKYNVNELQSALEKVLYHKILGVDMSEKTKMFIKQNYDWEVVIDKVEKLLDESSREAATGGLTLHAVKR